MPRLLRPLPIVLVAAMLAIAAGLELTLFDRISWLPKLPLLFLLALAFRRGCAPGSSN